MLEGSTLLELQGLPPNITAEEQNQFTVADPAFPSAVAIDLVPGADAAPLAARIADAGPGEDPGGTYRQPRVLGAAIVYAAQMGSQPLVLALALAAAAVLPWRSRDRGSARAAPGGTGAAEGAWADQTSGT